MFFTPVIRRASFAPALTPGFRSVDRNFERWLADSFAVPAAKAYTLEQDDTAFTLSVDLPGIAREQLSIGIEGNVVRLETKPEASRQVKLACELPQDIDAATSQAKLENGVLTLKLGKKAVVSNVTELAIS